MPTTYRANKTKWLESIYDNAVPRIKRIKRGMRRRVSKNRKYEVDRLHKSAPVSGYWNKNKRRNPGK